MKNNKFIKISALLAVFFAVLLIVAYSKTEPEKTYSIKVLNTFPHDKEAFTQGLVFDNGYLYESTGLHGRSSIRKVEIRTGKVLKKTVIPKKFFGEGITIFNNKIYQLTWRAKTGFIYDKESLENIGSFNYQTQGWGITHDDKNLILSDGSSNLYFLDPDSFETVKVLSVKTKEGKDIKFLNELEYIDGKIFSNVWQTNQVLIIDPENGIIENILDLSNLKKKIPGSKKIDVFNGIAYNPNSKTFYFTGKLWPKLFEVKLIFN